VVVTRKKNKKNEEGEGGKQEREESALFKSLMAVTSVS